MERNNTKKEKRKVTTKISNLKFRNHERTRILGNSLMEMIKTSWQSEK